MSSTVSDAQARVEQAYAWAAGLVDLAYRLVGESVVVDIAPTQPAIRDLCEVVRYLPQAQALLWVDRLVGLQHRLEQLGVVIAERDGAAPDPEARSPR